jgi:pyrimidine-nucleoside phosphorylase
MSKKLASGADVIVLDVKCGEGACMKTQADAETLAKELVSIGRQAGRKVTAVITDMDEPLGYAVGNALEVKEAIAALHGEECGELLNLCLTLGSCILLDAGLAEDETTARTMLRHTVEDGTALEKLKELVAAQNGEPHAVEDVSLLPEAPVQLDVPSEEEGFVKHIAAEKVGLVSMGLGGGRVTKESVIDLSVGVVLKKKVGDRVEKGDSLAVIHAASEAAAEAAAAQLRACYTFTDKAFYKEPFVKKIIR